MPRQRPFKRSTKMRSAQKAANNAVPTFKREVTVPTFKREVTVPTFKTEESLFVDQTLFAASTMQAEPTDSGHFNEDAKNVLVAEHNEGEVESEGEEEFEDGSGDEGEVDSGKSIEKMAQNLIANIGVPYDSRKEPLPQMPAYHPLFPFVERRYHEIIDTALDLLRTSKYQGVETAQLLKRAESLRTIEYPTGTRVGLLGESGTGMH